MRHLVKTIVALLVVAALAAAVFAWQVREFMHNPMTIAEQGMQIEVKPGTAFSTLSYRLAAAGLHEHPRWLSWYVRITDQAGAIQAGEYHLQAGTTPAELLTQLVGGDVTLYSFTIVEGWNIRELRAALSAHPAITTVGEQIDNTSLMQELKSEYAHPEGLFLPETYRFPKGTTELALLAQAHELMLSTLTAAWEKRAEAIPLSDSYAALILASIIEKETARSDEREKISGVFTRRLQRKMRLQTDPTVIYGLGPGFNGNLTRKNLRSDTPYNTYTRGGLPPTPIAMPGAAAINAALHPAAGTELFFVATGLGDGSHKFSATQAEHEAAVREYLARLRAARRTKK